MTSRFTTARYRLRRSIHDSLQNRRRLLRTRRKHYEDPSTAVPCYVAVRCPYSAGLFLRVERAEKGGEKQERVVKQVVGTGAFSPQLPSVFRNAKRTDRRFRTSGTYQLFSKIDDKP